MRRQLHLKRVKGKGRGKGLGIPTFNFVVPKTINLTHGVYAGWLYTEGKRFPAAIHFGPRPVFGEEEVTIEAHIVGESLPQEDVDEIDLEFIVYIRSVQNFTSPQAMVERIKKDIESIKKALI